MSKKSRQAIAYFLFADFIFLSILGLLVVGSGIMYDSFPLASHFLPSQIHTPQILIGAWVALIGEIGIIIMPIVIRRIR